MKVFFKSLLFILCLSIGFNSCAKDFPPFSTGIKEFYDLPYYTGSDADEEKHKLNLFIPEGVERPPMMIWIHGGAWAVGGRAKETALAREFAKAGVAMAVISYRLSPALWMSPKLDKGIQHPEHIKDVARAFAWVYDHAKKYEYDQHSLFVGGYSAGAHLSALLATDPSYLTAVGRSVREIKAAIPIAGAYDMEAYYQDHLKENGQTMADQHVKGVFGSTMAQLKQASPTEYIDNQWAPMLVVSETDTYNYTLRYEDLAKKKGYAKMEFLHVRDKNHNGLFFDLAGSNSNYRDSIVQYINQHKADYQYLKKKGIDLAYKVLGEGEPLFLLNGGPGLPSHHFEGLAKILAAHYQVILFDQRGTGYSSLAQSNSSTVNMKLMVEDLDDLRTHLGFEQVHLMGHSFGGMYAMAYAAVHPNRVDKMILSHSGGMNLDYRNDVQSRIFSRLTEEDKALLASAANETNPELSNTIQFKAIAPGYVYDRALAPEIFKGLAFSTRFYPAINQLIYEDLEKTKFDLSASLKNFEQPTLIIHGEHDIINPDVAKYSHKVFPNAQLILLKDCAHYGWKEQPEIYFKAIHEFME